jgi:hypothetical protein
MALVPFVCFIDKLYFQVEYFVLNAPGSLQVTDWIIIFSVMTKSNIVSVFWKSLLPPL